jgi:tetratricopeptide (TPR) repeat protein
MRLANPEVRMSAQSSVRSVYGGPKDVGRAESLYRSAIAKPDLDYATQLLFAALVANPEHEQAFAAILAKIPVYASNKRRMIVRAADHVGGGSPADAFVTSLASYCAAPRLDEALACAAEAQKAGLSPYAVTLGNPVLQRLEAGDAGIKSAAVTRWLDVFEAAGAIDHAVRAAKAAARLFPDDLAFREREKNLLASQYMNRTQLTEVTSSREMLRDRAQQEAMHRPTDPNARVDELEQRFAQDHRLEDFREFVRALRESSPQRREAALPTLEDGLQRFGDRETRWFVREIKLERAASELRVHRRLLDERPDDRALREEHETLRRNLLRDQVDHLYEVVSALPSGAPERTKRQLVLAQKLFDAGRFEEAVKQAQLVKRRPESKLDAWVIMAKSFVQLGLTPEATECFQSIITELNATPAAAGGPEKVLEAKYAYAQFLADEAVKSRDVVLARQARKLCSDVMVEDIDYRGVRELAARVDATLVPGG